MKNKLKKSVFLLSSLMMLSVGVGIVNHVENTVNVAEAAASATVEVKSFSATSGDLDTVISYTTAKGGGTSAPAINGGEIRLYQNSNGGGNITIKCKENYIMKSITIGSSMKTSIAYTLGTDTTKSSSTSLAAGGKYTYNSSDFDSITFHCMGADKKSRLYVNYLSVTYESLTGEDVEVEEAYLLFDAGDHGYLDFDEDYTTNLKYVLPELNSIDSGWKFDGWFNEDGERVGMENEEVSFEEGAEVILTAQYKEIPQGLTFDLLNREFTGIKSGATTYADWTGKIGESGAVYAGNSAGSNDSIQLRTDKSNSGIVTTASGGLARSISLSFNTNTTSGRIVDVYGKNSAYSSAADLYNASNAGTKIGSFSYNGTGNVIELDINADYEYIGIRSQNKALYISEIEIAWEPKNTSSETYNVSFNGGIATFSSDVTTSYEVEKGESINVTLPTNDQINNPYAAQGVTTSVVFTSKLGTHNPGDVVEVSDKTEFTAIYTYSDSTVTVAQAIEIAKLTGTTNTPFDVTVKGTVSEIKDVYSEQYKNISFYIKDDSTETAFLCYRVSGGKDLVVGEEVAVTGKLVNYGSDTPEFTAGCTYVSFSAKSAINYQYDDDAAPTAVRFIGTLTNVDAESVESVTLSFVKDGVAANKEVELYTLYTSVADTFAAAENTYYVVYILNGVQNVLNQELQVTMTVTFNNGAEDLVATRTFTLGA